MLCLSSTHIEFVYKKQEEIGLTFVIWQLSGLGLFVKPFFKDQSQIYFLIIASEDKRPERVVSLFYFSVLFL